MLLDVSYQAPSDPVSGQDMVIELGGRILAQDGSPIPPGGRFPELVTVTVEQAHWVNVSGLKVGVPFYMWASSGLASVCPSAIKTALSYLQWCSHPAPKIRYHHKVGEPMRE